jgi:hypothetical protein
LEPYIAGASFIVWIIAAPAGSTRVKKSTAGNPNPMRIAIAMVLVSVITSVHARAATKRMMPTPARVASWMIAFLGGAAGGAVGCVACTVAATVACGGDVGGTN